MVDLGIRLQLLVGPTLPAPAPYSVADAFVSLEVYSGEGVSAARGAATGGGSTERDGFQAVFSLGKEPSGEYGLLRDGLLDPPNRFGVVAFFGPLLEVLIDGVITHHQVTPSREPGQARLFVTGEDISLKLDQEKKKRSHPNQSDSAIVTRILSEYAQHGIAPDVTPTSDVPLETDRVPSQQLTDLAYIQMLARRNGFVFYVEPTAPGVSTAHWGPEDRLGLPQPALTFDMGAESNVDDLNFGFDALRPVTPKVSILEPFSKLPIEIPLPSLLQPSLSARPAASLRTTRADDTANLNPIQAALRALTLAGESADAGDGRGVLDAARYGRALKARRLVGVRGGGQTQDGGYFVKRVTHRIQRGSYKQEFVLAREGRGAASPVLPV